MIKAIVLPPQIIQYYDRTLLSNLSKIGNSEDSYKYSIEIYLRKALRKIHPQDKAKKREYDRIFILLQETYERKKNEAEIERKARKEGKAFCPLPRTANACRFRRMES